MSGCPPHALRTNPIKQLSVEYPGFIAYAVLAFTVTAPLSQYRSIARFGVVTERDPLTEARFSPLSGRPVIVQGAVIASKLLGGVLQGPKTCRSRRTGLTFTRPYDTVIS